MFYRATTTKPWQKPIFFPTNNEVLQSTTNKHFFQKTKIANTSKDISFFNPSDEPKLQCLIIILFF
jgi:hypothetical protein